MPTDEETVDKLIGEFDAWFQARPGGNDPIVRSERAIIKTFCYFLIHEKERTKVPHIEQQPGENHVATERDQDRV
jgi:hypothetical protein